MPVAIGYILISVLLGATGQILLKRGMSRIGELTPAISQLPVTLWHLATNPYVVGGLIVYMAGTFFWLVALSRVDLSFAYPFASLSYVVMLVAAWLLLNEAISVQRIVGSIIVIAGVIVISRS